MGVLIHSVVQRFGVVHLSTVPRILPERSKVRPAGQTQNKTIVLMYPTEMRSSSRTGVSTSSSQSFYYVQIAPYRLLIYLNRYDNCAGQCPLYTELGVTLSILYIVPFDSIIKQGIVGSK